ncbi:MAG: ATP-dependent RecD-like DNA helicase [Legionellales bacterium]|nr:MAG: ATP-dependent RecD-like DNA helicase [Legionellales bacterium]
MEQLQGIIERVTFHNEDSGFAVLQVKISGKRDLVTVVGSAILVSAGANIECKGDWDRSATHGVQFKSDKITVIPPTTLAGIEKYLGSGLIKGIGPHFAKRLVKAFGDSVLDVIDTHPNKLLELPGIGEKRLQQILQAWGEQRAIREIMLFLHSYGIGTNRAARIYKVYGANAITKITENPYRLATDIHGIGFKTADSLGVKLGIPRDSLLRAKAGINHVLKDITKSGHAAIPMEKLTESSCALLEVADTIVAKVIAAEVIAGNLVQEDIDVIPCVFLDKLYQAEISIAKNIARIKSAEFIWPNFAVQKSIAWAEKVTGINLSVSQVNAVQLALTNKMTIITGGPGVGKTTIVKVILTVLQSKTNKIHLGAPTGRAAKRLLETTGMQAKTIHRMLEFDPTNFKFRKNAQEQLDAEVLIIDETSMLDLIMMQNLLQAIPKHCLVIFIGDVDQLPSVGPGSVLAHLIDANKIATAQLIEIFRQAASSQIITNAHRINQGKLPSLENDRERKSDFYFIEANTPEEITGKLLEVVARRIPNSFGFKPIRDIQVLVPMNRSALGTHALNIALQERLNPHATAKITKFGTTFAVGDKVQQIVNNYDKEVFNGDIGFIDAINLVDQQVWIDFDSRILCYELSDLDEVVLAYATTIHKAQGSEYPVVVLPIAMQHFALLERNLIYTGVTRGKQLVVIIGQKQALAMAVHNGKAQQRLTNLKLRLQEFC